MVTCAIGPTTPFDHAVFSNSGISLKERRYRARRVARRGCPRPAPEEPSVIVSHHSARAAQRPASIRADPGTRNAPRATFAIPTHSRCTCLSTMLEVHTPVTQRPFAFPHINGSPSFLATYHLSDVGSLSCRVTLKPVSVRLQNGNALNLLSGSHSPGHTPVL
jgi:hypothetical protein